MASPHGREGWEVQSFFCSIRPGYIHSGYNRAEERTTGAERKGNVDCNHIYGRPFELTLR